MYHSTSFSSNRISSYIPRYLKLSGWTPRLFKMKQIRRKYKKKIFHTPGTLFLKAQLRRESYGPGFALSAHETRLHFIDLRIMIFGARRGALRVTSALHFQSKNHCPGIALREREAKIHLLIARATYAPPFQRKHHCPGLALRGHGAKLQSLSLRAAWRRQWAVNLVTGE